ncbi:hypothetical protein ACWCQK_41115 [Streptomyces sp. NPDC002306]
MRQSSPCPESGGVVVLDAHDRAGEKALSEIDVIPVMVPSHSRVSVA